jgi:hypothetical protein
MMIGELSGIAPGHDCDDPDDSLEFQDFLELLDSLEFHDLPDLADRQDSSDSDSKLAARTRSEVLPPPIAARRWILPGPVLLLAASPSDPTESRDRPSHPDPSPPRCRASQAPTPPPRRDSLAWLPADPPSGSTVTVIDRDGKVCAYRTSRIGSLPPHPPTVPAPTVFTTFAVSAAAVPVASFRSAVE